MVIIELSIKNLDSMEPKKVCSICNKTSKALFRCRYDHKKIWEFLCQECLSVIKLKYKDNYQYGGTKKFK